MVKLMKSTTDGQNGVEFKGEQIGTLHRTQHGYFFQAHGEWSGMRAQGISRDTALKALIRNINGAVFHARNLLVAIQDGAKVKDCKVQFANFHGIDTRPMRNDQFIKFLEKIAN